MNLILRQHRQANWQDVPTRRPAAITDNRVWPELGRGAASLRQWRRCRDFLLAPEVGNPCSPVGATLGERYPDLGEVGVEHRCVVTAGGLPVLQQERCSGPATGHVFTEEPGGPALDDARLEGTPEGIRVTEPVVRSEIVRHPAGATLQRWRDGERTGAVLSAVGVQQRDELRLNGLDRRVGIAVRGRRSGEPVTSDPRSDDDSEDRHANHASHPSTFPREAA